MFHYFGYGSNLNLTSLQAKGVVPLSSERAVLHGWRLLFNVRHWFRHEGGVGNIHHSDDTADRVHGLVHFCEDEHLPLLDAMESYGVGYERIEVELETARGPMRALTYVGIPAYLDDACLPTRRYLNILLKGASRAGLDEAYVEKLRQHPVHPDKDYPPFQRPSRPESVFDRETLSRHPLYTAIAGAVFDMKDARGDLDCLQELFGGKDMTLFHLKRLDTSDGGETLEDVKRGHISAAGRKYLNAYLHEYNAEYRYVGRYVYD
jgi:sulfite reductase (NADPH) flavoprotein alpha-component